MPTSGIDERTLEAVIGALDNPDRFNELLQAVQSSSGGGASIGARAAALLGLIRKAIEVLKERDRLDQAAMLQTIADSAAHMTPDMMLSFLQQARETTETDEPPLAATIVDRMGDRTDRELRRAARSSPSGRERAACARVRNARAGKRAEGAAARPRQGQRGADAARQRIGLRRAVARRAPTC